MAHRDVRASTLATASDRLRTVAEVFAQPAQNTPAWARESQRIAADNAIIDIVRSNGSSSSESARTLLTSLTPDTGQTLATEVRNHRGEVLFSLASRLSDSLAAHIAAEKADLPRTQPVGDTDTTMSAGVDKLRLTRTYGDSAMTSELYARGGRVLYERAVPVRDGGRVVGHLVEIRTVVASTNAVRQLARLIGRNAVLVAGNSDGSLWTDLEKPIAHPPPSPVVQQYTRDGRTWLSATAQLPAAPWVIGVEFPKDIVLAPAEALKRRFVLIGAVIILLGAILAEWLSRGITTPLTRLTGAAERIAVGERTTGEFDTVRSDEIGRLSRAFSAMAESIRESEESLERQIGERTSELRTTLARLRDTQDELVRKERLATMGKLSGGIAHELRNPLAVITNTMYYLESVLVDSPPKVGDHLRKVRAQVRLSEKIINGLLDSTRAGSARPEVLQAAALIEEHLSRVDIPPRVQVIRDCPAGLPDVRADAEQVGQILVNLFTNALQAMESDGGTLSVTVRGERRGVRIAVADTGPGITPELRDSIFEPLFTTKARGIGLGLSISRSLARANGGDLTVDSSVDVGAVFLLDLPADAPPSDSHGVPHGDRAPAAVHS